MLSEDDKNERLFLVALVIALALAATKLRAAHHAPERTATTFVVPPAARADAKVAVVIAPGRVGLAGEVGSEGERATLVATAKSVFPTYDVDDGLRVAAGARNEALRAALAECAKVRWGAIQRVGDDLVVEGEVSSTVDRDALEGALRRAVRGPISLHLSARPAPAKEPHVLQATLAVSFAGPLIFSPLGTELNEADKAALDALVPSLVGLDGLEVRIEASPNLAEPATQWRDLALARATAAKRYLVSRGAAEGHIAVSAEHVAPALPPRLSGSPPKTVNVDTRFYVREVRAIK